MKPIAVPMKLINLTSKGYGWGQLNEQTMTKKNEIYSDEAQLHIEFLRG